MVDLAYSLLAGCWDSQSIEESSSVVGIEESIKAKRRNHVNTANSGSSRNSGQENQAHN